MTRLTYHKSMGKKVDLTEEQIIQRLAELGLLKASMEYKRQKMYFNNLNVDPEAEIEQAGEEEQEVRKE